MHAREIAIETTLRTAIDELTSIGETEYKSLKCVLDCLHRDGTERAALEKNRLAPAFYRIRTAPIVEPEHWLLEEIAAYRDIATCIIAQMFEVPDAERQALIVLLKQWVVEIETLYLATTDML